MITKQLYEILVPTKFEDTQKPVSTKHHREWDKRVLGISGGLTIFKPTKGKWIHIGQLYNDRMIPVRICCTPNQIDLIGQFTLKHYRQIEIMVYRVSEQVIFYKDL